MNKIKVRHKHRNVAPRACLGCQTRMPFPTHPEPGNVLVCRNCGCVHFCKSDLHWERSRNEKMNTDFREIIERLNRRNSPLDSRIVDCKPVPGDNKVILVKLDCGHQCAMLWDRPGVAHPFDLPRYVLCPHCHPTKPGEPFRKI